MSNVPDNHCSVAQSQRFAAAEILVEHAQAQRTGAFNGRNGVPPRTEASFSLPLEPLNTAQYSQLPPLLDNSRGVQLNGTQLPEFGSVASSRKGRPTSLDLDHHRQQHGFTPGTHTYGSLPYSSETNSVDPQRQVTSQILSGPGTVDSSRNDERISFPTLADTAPNERSTRGEESSEMHPAWTELKTKAGKERKRLPLACIACRRKKIRCSGEKPSCKHCLRSRIPCIYKVSNRKVSGT